MLGILGGTFDPIHLGHINMAEIALLELNLQKIMLLPSGYPPHKRASAAKNHRLNMLKIATENIDHFFINTYELSRKGTSYTADTLEALKQKYPHDDFVYIAGSDSLHNFHTWREPKKVASLCNMAVVLRNESSSDIAYLIDELKQEYGLKTILLKGKGLDIASSHIRQLVMKGKDISAFVPKGVEQYIVSNGLYLNCNSEENNA